MTGLMFYAAIILISGALVFYTIGTWAERIQKIIKPWHIVFFLLGLVCDTLGTTIMTCMAQRLGGVSDPLHAVTGVIAIILMGVHAVWAIVTYWKGSAKAKQNFSKFSVVVWAFWLIPYVLGIFMGASHS